MIEFVGRAGRVSSPVVRFGGTMVIGHFMHGLWSQGGVASYLREVTSAQRRLGHHLAFFDSLAGSGKAATSVRSGEELVKAARDARVDVLHLHIDPPGGFPGGIPAVRTVHGHHPYCPSGSQFLTAGSAPCERLAGPLICTWGHLADQCGSRRPNRILQDLRRVHSERRSAEHVLLIAVSQFGRGRLIRAGYDPHRIRVIPNASPVLDGVAPLDVDGSPRFLFLGRIVAGKGLAWLVEAMALAQERVTLDVLGAGRDEEDVRRLVAERGLERRISFHGWKESSEVREFLASARAVVIPSLWHEPAGLAAIEAAMHHRPSIVSAVGGLREIVVADATGILVSPGDTVALGAALDRLGSDPDLSARMGTAGYGRARELYSIDHHVARLLDSYAEVV